MKMKKILSMILAIVMACSVLVTLTACNDKDTDGTTKVGEPGKTDTYEIALITDKGTIDDKSFNQGAWEGVVQYATEFNKTHKYYQPTEASDNDYIAAIELAIKGGAKIVVCPGFLFEVAIYNVQSKYPEVNFILLDGAPRTEDSSDFRTDKNVVSIFYAEEEAGFLAGYAAVKDGMKGLGFMGGMAVPPVIRFGYGYIQGAEAAAKELGLEKGSVNVKYYYTGDFKATPDIETMSASWFKSNIDVIFGCGGAVGNSVMSAAEKMADKKVIGVDVDQSKDSETVITSAIKLLKKSVYDNITDYYNDSFKGGISQILDAKVDGVGLPMATSKFTTFNQADYEAVYAKIVSGDYTILKDDQVGKDGDPTTADAENKLPALVTEYVKVDYVKK
ncbi:MAG TPA: BMP family ABC transporter substrate-binding protein [Clostridia bacterium]|nr:BMP family ABC transporter substrate-binding protein [Clostridia bacterium]